MLGTMGGYQARTRLVARRAADFARWRAGGFGRGVGRVAIVAPRHMTPRFDAIVYAAGSVESPG